MQYLEPEEVRCLALTNQTNDHVLGAAELNGFSIRIEYRVCREHIRGSRHRTSAVSVLEDPADRVRPAVRVGPRVVPDLDPSLDVDELTVARIHKPRRKRGWGGRRCNHLKCECRPGGRRSLRTRACEGDAHCQNEIPPVRTHADLLPGAG